MTCGTCFEIAKNSEYISYIYINKKNGKSSVLRAQLVVHRCEKGTSKSIQGLYARGGDQMEEKGGKGKAKRTSCCFCFPHTTP